MTAAARIDDPRVLEDEAVHILREVAAELERPVLLFSGGKDSIVLLRLAEKAFRPVELPFPVLHVDTGHNFPEVLTFRHRRIAEAGHELIVASVQTAIDTGRVTENDPNGSRNRLQTRTLLDALQEGRFDAAFGGARRDEERARAKERVFSVRDEFGQWEPRAQRAEPWALYNGRIRSARWPSHRSPPGAATRSSTPRAPSAPRPRRSPTAGIPRRSRCTRIPARSRSTRSVA